MHQTTACFLFPDCQHYHSSLLGDILCIHTRYDNALRWGSGGVCTPDLWRTRTILRGPLALGREDVCPSCHTNCHIWMKRRQRILSGMMGRVSGAEEKPRLRIPFTHPHSLPKPHPPSYSLGGLLLLIILLLKPERIPGSGPDERSAAELRRHWAVNRSKLMLSDDPTPCCFDTVAHKEAQALAGWQSLIVFFNRYLYPLLSKSCRRLPW